MGKMKEAFMEMEESSWKGKPSDFLKYYVKYYIENEAVPTDILCPKCKRSKLTMYNTDDVKCESCRTAYTLIDINTVKFKN